MCAGCARSLGFKAHTDIEGALVYPRISTCVESLLRVPADTVFSLVFMDEILGILSQLISSTVPDHGAVCARIVDLLVKAKRVFASDAYGDNTLVHDFLLHLCRLRALYHGRPCRLTAIRNGWVRPPPEPSTGLAPRRGLIFITDNPGRKGEKAVQGAFMAAVLAAVRAGEKVACPCATKSVAVALHAMLLREVPGLAVALYTSDTSPQDRRATLENINRVWKQFAVVIFTNAIESGASFEVGALRTLWPPARGAWAFSRVFWLPRGAGG